jgi:hypothetical protein
MPYFPYRTTIPLGDVVRPDNGVGLALGRLVNVPDYRETIQDFELLDYYTTDGITPQQVFLDTLINAQITKPSTIIDTVMQPARPEVMDKISNG